MGYPAQTIDRAGEAELVRLRIERTLEEADALVFPAAPAPARSEEIQMLLTQYEELRWHALALAT